MNLLIRSAKRTKKESIIPLHFFFLSFYWVIILTKYFFLTSFYQMIEMSNVQNLINECCFEIMNKLQLIPHYENIKNHQLSCDGRAISL